MSVCLCDKLTLSFSLSNTKATWAKKAPRIRGMEALSACCYQDKAGWEEKRGRVSLTLVGITARRCVRVCACASCVCASSLSLMHLSVRACACIRAYIFLHIRGVGVRAHPGTIHTHIKIYTDNICIIVNHWCICRTRVLCMYIHMHIWILHMQIRIINLHLQTDIYVCTQS